MANIHCSESKASYIIVVCGLLLLSFTTAKTDEVEVAFDRAYSLLNYGDYARSHRILMELCRDNPDHPEADRNLFFKGKAEYYLSDFSECINDLNKLINRYGRSSFVPYAYYYLGNAFYRQEKADKAIEAYFRAYAISPDKELDNLTLHAIETGAMHASPTALAAIKTTSISGDKRCKVLIAICRTLMKLGNYQLVSSMLSSCQTSEAINLSKRADQYLRQKAEVGVVLPLSGDLMKYGEQILDGIRLRIEQFVTETGRNLAPVVYDTKGDNLEAARIVRRLSDGAISAAIGPLTSDAGALASAMLSCSDLPLIIPAASQGGLTELSSSSFQLQPNLEWQGLRMADFAISQLEADTAAIITPTSTENLRMAKAFKKRFEDLGGTILGVEYFRAKETDFGPFVKDLKSLIIGDLLDSIIFINDDGDTIEAEEVPVWIDCIYMPAGAGQLRQLLPQINFYNLNTVYLGGDGWGTSTVYGLGDRITKDCYFSSGLIGDNQSEEAVKFSADFDLKHGRQPGRLEALGYDAMSLICQALYAGNYSRQEINGFLSTVENYHGIAGKVTFGEHRENIELPIYTIENGEPIKVEIE